MAEQAAYLKTILAKVRHLEIQVRRLSRGALSGAYHSVFKGQGMHFEEVREYSSGDEVRAIDWNVTARTGRPFVKVFREERERTVLLMLDLSASLAYGSGDCTKRERLAELAGVLAFTALNAGDKLGLLIFTDKVEVYLPPKKGTNHGLRILREALFYKPQGRATNIPAALEYLNRMHRRRAVVFLISDFLGTESNTITHSLALTQRRHELNALILQDPREQTLPATGCVTLEDAETGELITLDTSRKNLREIYEKANTQRSIDLLKNLHKAGVPALTLSTAGNYLIPLRRFLDQRIRQH